jgi:hypothetical protein
MATYRVGNHQPQNLYRDDQYIGVMFTAEDAALVVEAMEGHTPDVDYLHGAAEALAEMRRQMGGDDTPTFPGFEKMLRDAAAELGVGAEAPAVTDLRDQLAGR